MELYIEVCIDLSGKNSEELYRGILVRRGESKGVTRRRAEHSHHNRFSFVCCKRILTAEVFSIDCVAFTIVRLTRTSTLYF